MRNASSMNVFSEKVPPRNHSTVLREEQIVGKAFVSHFHFTFDSFICLTNHCTIPFATADRQSTYCLIYATVYGSLYRGRSENEIESEAETNVEKITDWKILTAMNYLPQHSYFY